VSPSGSDWDNEFTDPANGDFTPLDSGNIYHAGIAISGLTTDMSGETWNDPPTIGANEVVSGGTGYTLTADAGSYTITGSDASLLFDRSLSAESGSFSITGSDASLLLDRSLSAEQGSYSITGSDATLRINRSLSAELLDMTQI